MNKKILIIGLCIIILLSSLASADLTTSNSFYYSENDDDITGLNPLDSSSNGKDGIGTLLTTGATGFLEEAFTFDGTGDRVRINALNIDTSDFSLDGFFNPDSSKSSGNGMIAQFKCGASAYISMYFLDRPTGLIKAYQGNCAGTQSLLTTISTTPLSKDSYNYVAITKSGGTVKVYINGTLDKTTSVENYNYEVTDIYYGGRSDGNLAYGWIGEIDEYSLWDGRILNTSDIAERWNSGLGKNFYKTAIPVTTYFTLTAKDEYDTTAITTFNATVNGTYYNTTNGTITTNILDNSTDLISITVRANNYFNKEYLSQAVTSNLEAKLTQAELTLQGLRKILNTSITGNFTINGTPIPGNNLNIKAGTYEVTFNSSGWFDKSENITITPLYNGTKNITGIYDTLLNITVLNAYTSNPLENFTGWVYDNVTGYNESYTVNSYEGFIGLIKNRNYSIYATNPSYAIDSSLNYKYDIWNNTYYNISFSLYTNNSIYIKIYDENTGILITGTNISIIVTGNASEITYTTTNGLKYLDNLEDGVYSIKFTGGNYTLKTYTVTVADRSTQNLNAYLSTSEETVILTVRDSDTSAVIPGSSVTMYKLINASWVVTESKNTDITGRTQFTYIPGIQYKFFISKSGYDDKIFYLDPIIFDSYNINLDKVTSLSQDQNYLGINIQYYPTKFYDNQTNNFTWIVQSPDGVLQNYNMSISYPGGNNYQNGVNANGEEFTHSFNLSGLTVQTRINLTYCYKTSIGTNSRCYSFSYSIIGVYEDNSFTAMKDNSYGLSLLTRIIIASMIVIIVAGIFSFLSNGLIGGVIGLFLFGFLAYIDFIPLYSVLLSLVIGVIFIIWRSD